MLPVTGLAVGIVALLALALPGVRQQIELSASHQPQEYVALSFSRDAAGTVPVCTGAGDEVSVSFTVDSGLRETRTLKYVVTAGNAERTGTVAVAAGESEEVTQVLHRPGHSFDIIVRLPADHREISAHCRSAARGKTR